MYTHIERQIYYMIIVCAAKGNVWDLQVNTETGSFIKIDMQHGTCQDEIIYMFGSIQKFGKEGTLS